MKYQHTFQLNTQEKEELIELWNKEYPASLAFRSHNELDTYLRGLLAVRHTIVKVKDQCIAWQFNFKRDNQLFFAIIIDSNYQKQGLGMELLKGLKKNNHSLYAWVIDHTKAIKQDGGIYNTPLQFYLKQGFKTISDERLETDKISAVKIYWKK